MDVLAKLLAALVSMHMPCTEPQILTDAHMPMHGRYERLDHTNIIWVNRTFTSSLILAHELSHCAMTQRRELNHKAQPPDFDPEEEARAVIMSHELLERAQLEGNEQWISTSKLLY